MKDVRLERFDANSEGATLVERFVEDGSEVTKGQTICSVETTKTLYEVTAPAAGYLRWYGAVGETIAFGSTLATLADTEAALSSVPASAPVTPAASVKASKRARQLAAKHNFALESIDTGKIITEADVQRALGLTDASRERTEASSVLSFAQPTGAVPRLCVFGAGVGCVQALDIVQRRGEVQVAAVFDDDVSLHGQTVFGVSVAAAIKEGMSRWRAGEFELGLIAISNLAIRRRLFEMGKAFGGTFYNAIDPSVVQNSMSSLGEGNVICTAVHLGTHSSIGDNNIISAQCSFDHHNSIGSHNRFGPAVVTSGEVSIGSEINFGTGIFIQPMLSIGDRCQIASGAILLESVPEEHAVRTAVNCQLRPLRGS